MTESQTTIVALASPAGESALAILRVSGPACKGIAESILGAFPKVRYMHRINYKSLENNSLDDCCMVFFPEKASYSGEDSLEFYLHGNPYLIEQVLADLQRRGCLMAEPGEFTQRAYLNGKLDLLQAEAVADLIAAKSVESQRCAHAQLGGQLSLRFKALTSTLAGLMARIEAYLDFADEDLPEEDTQAWLNEFGQLYKELEALLESIRYRGLLKNGLSVAITGAPNAGKSSLFNALLAENRAIVSPQAGTTRDPLIQPIELGGYHIQLQDTAGIAEPTKDSIEALGIEKSYEILETADVLILVIEASVPLPAFPKKFLKYLELKRAFILQNKIDLPIKCCIDGFFPSHAHFKLSLKNACERKLGGFKKELLAAFKAERKIPNELGFVINARHASKIEETLGHLNKAAEYFHAGHSKEYIAEELRTALEALGQLTAPVGNEQVLDHLFAGFCIGK